MFISLNRQNQSLFQSFLLVGRYGTTFFVRNKTFLETYRHVFHGRNVMYNGYQLEGGAVICI